MAKITTHTAQRHVMRGDGVLGNEVPGSAVQAGILELDGTAANIQPVGATASAGSGGLAADSGHVHAGLSPLATTGASGYALVNGTGTILTWTAPNDGAMHRVTWFGQLWVANAETGGQISVSITDPGSHASGTQAIDAGGHGANFHQPSYWNLAVAANAAVTISQTSALTAGAATLYLELWGL